jgi:hypothetical protein
VKQGTEGATENAKLIVDTINFKRVWAAINAWWASSMVAVLLFLLGLYIGSINTESRIVSDCKFAGSFRVDIQAFTCQRKI